MEIEFAILCLKCVRRTYNTTKNCIKCIAAKPDTFAVGTYEVNLIEKVL